MNTELETLSVDEILSKFSETPNEKPTNIIEPTEGKNPLDIAQTLSSIANDKSVEEILEELENKDKPKEKEEDEVQTPEVAKTGRPKDKLDSNELTAIQLLIDNGKIQPWIDDQNQVILPATKQELLELMDQNLETINSNSFEVVSKQFYETKSPIWQQLLKFSETAKSLDEVLPLFNSFREIETLSEIDIDNVEHQEYIIKKWESIKGLDLDTISTDIEDLKERGKLKERAEKLKPNLDKVIQQQAQQEILKKEQAERQNFQVLQTYYNNVVENVVNKKEIAGIKMKDEHRHFAASTLVPDEQLGGLPIYTIIDDLVKKGEFETLTRIALLATNPKVHDSYFNIKNANEVAVSLQRQLRDANTTKMTSSSATVETPTTTNTKAIDWKERSKKWL